MDIDMMDRGQATVRDLSMTRRTMTDRGIHMQSGPAPTSGVNDDENRKALIVYDGDCVFCSRSMAWIVEHDVHDRIRLTPCTSETGSTLMRTHGIDPDDPSTFLVVIDGRPYVRSAAMLALVPILDRTVRPLSLLRLVPSPLRDAVYGWTARNRRRIIKGECPVPSAAMRSRIIP
jgi:predicted DCC family thiol-disulfide oxidoreductase YuxK